MKKLVVLMALMAFAFSAPAHCGNCGSDGDKPKVECKKCKEKDCGDDCKCKCHKADDHGH